MFSWVRSHIPNPVNVFAAGARVRQDVPEVAVYNATFDLLGTQCMTELPYPFKSVIPSRFYIANGI